MTKAVYVMPDVRHGSSFGAKESFRTHPHRGDDFLYGENEVIPFPTDAVIYDIFWSDVIGWVTEFVDAEGMHLQMAHLAKKPKSYKVGDQVKVGQPAGRCGGGSQTPSGSASTGAHLHMSASKKKHPHLVAYKDLVSPYKYMKARVAKAEVKGE